ncbi:coiled-coil domain-containing protein 103 [Coregonus clupeaformis]|uniref:coiled-coil domain-containing protein 103 n=1 Tax=Coregonus clupeaformis TaxID=59861 RepID=UPI001BE08181|nr:coiled-coil domain-containing protein 103 [Coregonus clupeaformis]XP_041718941.1 coiled-coil domain-containing protein 103 [Coregonus clupeaformis]
MDDSAEVINFSALERELQSAVEADKKYQRENDAKFRALHQKVGTYEEFRDIVLASHLKPLDRKDKAGAPRKQPWNALASTVKGQNQTSCDEIGLKPQLSEFQPKTASEFSRDWRRFSSENPEDKYSLLLSLGGEGLRDIFRAEVGFGLLGEFLVFLSRGLQPGDEATVIGVLEGLSKTPRFGLNMSFLSRAEREACGELFQNLRKASAAGNSSVRGPEDDVIVHGSNVEEIKEAQDDEAETLCPGPGQTSEAAGGSSDTETLNGIMQLYGVQTVSPPQ